MTDRYKIVNESQSGHCCFHFTIVDTTKPFNVGHSWLKPNFEPLCECFEMEDAKFICDALNGAKNDRIPKPD